MRNRVISGSVFLILGGLVSIGPQCIFPVCEAMEKTMKCFWTARAEIGIGALISLLGILLFLFKSNEIRIGISISILLGGGLALLIPTYLIGVCSMPSMRCHGVTLPALYLSSIVIIIASFVNIIYLKRLIIKDKKAYE